MFILALANFMIMYWKGVESVVMEMSLKKRVEK